jgi:hypothetical protein
LTTLGLLLMSIVAWLQPPAADPAAPSSGAFTAAMPDLGARLTALTPDDPDSYYLLGEEVADVAVEESERVIARRLFLIAYTNWLERGENRKAASACLALTTVVTSERDRSWLRAVAGSLDPREGSVTWDPASWTEIDPAVARQAATALGAVRSGDGILARQILADARVTRALERYGSLLQSAGGLTRIQRDANIWPCPDCRNKRTIRSRTSQDSGEIVCGYCRGDPGPRLRDDEVVAHLRVESLLLSGDQNLWSAQLEVDGGSPLRDPAPAVVSHAFGIDPSQSLYRAGQWVWPPGKEPAPRPDPKPDPDSDAEPKPENETGPQTPGGAG